jgi:hypothetical protein
LIAHHIQPIILSAASKAFSLFSHHANISYQNLKGLVMNCNGCVFLIVLATVSNVLDKNHLSSSVLTGSTMLSSNDIYM